MTMGIPVPDAPNACCRDAANLELVEYREVPNLVASGLPGIFTMTQCKKCGRKHRRLSTPPMTAGSQGEPASLQQGPQ